MRLRGCWVLISGAVLTAACSSPRTADLARYQELLSRAGEAVADHLDAGTQVSNVPDCTAEHAGYDARMRSLLEEMQAMSPDMDDCMSALGNRSAEGFQATCAAMRSELDTHGQHACQSADPAGNRAETRRDCDAMTGYLHDEQASCTAAGRMMDGAMMSGGGCPR